MKRHPLAFILLAIIIFPSLSGQASAINEKRTPEENGKERSVSGEIIVRYKDEMAGIDNDTGKLVASSIETERGMTVKDEIPEMNIRLLKTEGDVTDAITELEKDPRIEYAEPNYRRYPAATPNDNNFPLQWNLDNTGQTVNGYAGTPYADIWAEGAWDKESGTQPDITVAVIDSGVNINHIDLVGNLWNGSSCKDDNNSAIPDGCPYHGWDYEDGDSNPDDSDGHGSGVAGVIGATTGNTSGMSGLSYRNNLKIMALKFDYDVISEVKAINFAKWNGARVINASFGGPDYSQAERDAISAFPGIFAAAAGNGNYLIGYSLDASPYYPASYTSSNLIAVASTDQDDLLSGFSNFGAASVDIAAPGESIVCTNDGASTYTYCTGTSFATPHVAGAAAMLMSHFPTYSTSDVKQKILSTGDRKSWLSGKLVSGARLNLSAAMDSDTPPSTASIYRFWSGQKQGHFYTVSLEEKNAIVANDPSWTYEGIAYAAFQSSAVGISPIYRFWSAQKQHHFFTISEAEKDSIIANDHSWTYEGIAYYAYSGSTAGTMPIYRFWSGQKQGHFFTSSQQEKDQIIATDPSWAYEGIAWYVPAG